MLTLLATLLPVLLIDVLNPVLFALMVFAAGTKRSILNSTSLLLGHTLAYFAVGILLSFGIERISARLENPQGVDFAASALVGALLVWTFFALRKNDAPEAATPPRELTPGSSLVTGAIVNFIGIPFALPYFGAIDQILKAELGWGDSLAALAAYNLAYALAFSVVPVSVAILGAAAKPMLEKLNALLVKASELISPWLILALGAWMLFDAARWFYSGWQPGT